MLGPFSGQHSAQAFIPFTLNGLSNGLPCPLALTGFVTFSAAGALPSIKHTATATYVNDNDCATLALLAYFLRQLFINFLSGHVGKLLVVHVPLVETLLVLVAVSQFIQTNGGAGQLETGLNEIEVDAVISGNIISFWLTVTAPRH